MTDDRRRGLIILEAEVSMVHIAAAYQVVPPADLVPVNLGPSYRLGLGHAPVIADEKVKFSKCAAQVIQFCPIDLGNSDKSPLPQTLKV